MCISQGVNVVAAVYVPTLESGNVDGIKDVGHSGSAHVLQLLLPL